MILAHVMGIPIEESVLELAPAGAAMVTAVAVAGRTGLGRLRRRTAQRRPRAAADGPASAATAPAPGAHRLAELISGRELGKD